MSEMLATLRALGQRMQSLFALGRVTASRDDRPTQSLQLSFGPQDARDDVPALGAYGFTSRPLPGAEAVVVFLGGSRTDPIVICTGDRQYRLRNLAPGEVALYSDEGDSVALRRGRVVEITAGTKVRMVTPLLEVTGDVVAGTVSLRNHRHSGVQTGGGTTGTPQT